MIPKLINQAELARILWPNNKSAEQYLADKLAGRQRKKLTDADKIRIKQAIQHVLDELPIVTK